MQPSKSPSHQSTFNQGSDGRGLQQCYHTAEPAHKCSIWIQSGSLSIWPHHNFSSNRHKEWRSRGKVRAIAIDIKEPRQYWNQWEIRGKTLLWLDLQPAERGDFNHHPLKFNCIIADSQLPLPWELQFIRNKTGPAL